jgi:hypothetical protein
MRISRSGQETQIVSLSSELTMWSSGVICRVEIDTGILSTCYNKTHDFKLAALHMLT